MPCLPRSAPIDRIHGVGECGKERGGGRGVTPSLAIATIGTMKSLLASVDRARSDPAALEALYREAASAGDDSDFKDAISSLLADSPSDLLLQAWAHRLDIPVEETVSGKGPAESATDHRWRIAIPIAVLLGFVFALLAWGETPVPFPGVGMPGFVLGWGPAVAAAIVVLIFAARRDNERLPVYGGALLVLAILFGLGAWKGWMPSRVFVVAPGLPGDSAVVDEAGLIALHLPLVCWAVLAATLCAGMPDLWKQLYAFVLKSAETIVTAGLYLIAGVVFSGLTYGIFSVLGVDIPNEFAMRFAAWGLGVIPLLAVATVYDPTRSPLDQSWDTGLARVIRILVRLLLPLTLAVLVVYVAYFIPMYFMRAFKQRETLIVYNATIVAIIAVLATAAPGLDERLAGRGSQILRWAIIVAGVLTLLLNAYALAAIVGRTISGGYSPNRHAVIGWNITTLAMLASVLLRQALVRGRPWAEIFRRSIAQALVLAMAWSTWVVVGLPHF